MSIVSEDPQVTKLEKDAERSRAQLSETVGDLRDKITDSVSPEAVKREVKDFVQNSGERMLDTIKRRAYDNPLQAVAVTALVGYPLWRMFANVPLPVLMVGTGMALAGPGSKSPSMIPRRQSDGRAVSLDGGKEAASDMLTGATDRVKGAAENVGAAISETTTATVKAVEASAEEAFNAFDRYPLIVGAIGVGMGALVGAALPASSAERELVGDLSEDLQGRAREMMASGVEKAKKATTEVYDEAAKEAERQGLTGEKIQEGARRLKDDVIAGMHDDPHQSPKKRNL